MLPFERESIESMAARYPQAIEEICDVESAKLGVGWMPGGRRANVFDFEDGMRMIVSRDESAEFGIKIHFSASANPESVFYADIANGLVDRQQYLNLCVERFRAISGCDRIIRLGYVSEGGIPHFVVD